MSLSFPYEMVFSPITFDPTLEYIFLAAVIALILVPLALIMFFTVVPYTASKPSDTSLIHMYVHNNDAILVPRSSGATEKECGLAVLTKLP